VLSLLRYHKLERAGWNYYFLELEALHLVWDFRKSVERAAHEGRPVELYYPGKHWLPGKVTAKPA
jgi:hypothetical protein